MTEDTSELINWYLDSWRQAASISDDGVPRRPLFQELPSPDPRENIFVVQPDEYSKGMVFRFIGHNIKYLFGNAQVGDDYYTKVDPQISELTRILFRMVHEQKFGLHYVTRFRFSNGISQDLINLRLPVQSRDGAQQIMALFPTPDPSSIKEANVIVTDHQNLQLESIDIGHGMPGTEFASLVEMYTSRSK